MQYIQFDDSQHRDQLLSINEVANGAHDVIAHKIKNRFMQGMTEALLQKKNLDEIQDPVFQLVVNYQDDFIKDSMWQWLQEWAYTKEIGHYNIVNVVSFERIDILDMLTKAHVDLYSNSYYSNPLFFAVMRKNSQVVHMLLDAGVSLNEDILAIPVLGNNPTMLGILLKSDAARISRFSLDAVERLLGIAALYNYPKIVSLLLETNMYTSKTCNSVLMTAIRFKNSRIVRTMLDAHVNINFKNSSGLTPLMYATSQANTEIIKIFKQAKLKNDEYKDATYTRSYKIKKD
ncbi:ankyrin repeat domain-containing protein [Candidatus Chromulinivorax destructor]|uniref:ankyrin repeat domain-containing protein n=1 Tax=Candidatus Chromulinivorax destructor TaxID=2066483 RepID=UPI0013B396D9|nr:ankyrin repeat domain-containing protein [Candidatus Chromulinivorax destructor]